MAAREQVAHCSGSVSGVCGEGGGARTDVFNFTVHGRAQMTKVMSYSSRTCLCMTRCLYTVAFVVRSLAKYM